MRVRAPLPTRPVVLNNTVPYLLYCIHRTRVSTLQLPAQPSPGTQDMLNIHHPSSLPAYHKLTIPTPPKAHHHCHRTYPYLPFSSSPPHHRFPASALYQPPRPTLARLPNSIISSHVPTVPSPHLIGPSWPARPDLPPLLLLLLLLLLSSSSPRQATPASVLPSSLPITNHFRPYPRSSHRPQHAKPTCIM